MNSKQRILEALRLGIPDKVPVSLLMPGFWQGADDMDAVVDLIDKTDPILDINPEMIYGIIFGKRIHEYNKITIYENKVRNTITTPKGELTSVFEMRGEVIWIREPLFKSMDDLEKFYSFKYEPYDSETMLSELGAYRKWKEILGKKVSEKLFFFSYADASFTLYMCVGPEEYYMSLIDNYEEVKEFTSIVSDRIVDYTKAFKGITDESPIVIRIYGQEIFGVPMANENLYKDLVVPYDKKLVKTIHDIGGLAYNHCHGNTKNMMKHIIDIGIDAMGPFEDPPKGNMTLKEVKENLIGKVCIYGNIDEMQIIQYADKKEIKLRTLKALRDASAGGGFILGGSEAGIFGRGKGLADGFIYMTEIVNDYGTYPIDLERINSEIKRMENI